jgi:hypothetical protein
MAAITAAIIFILKKYQFAHPRHLRKSDNPFVNTHRVSSD